MALNDNCRNSEAGLLSLSGWRRDSARRRPLRQAGLSLVRDLSPRWTGGVNLTKVRVVASAVTGRPG